MIAERHMRWYLLMSLFCMLLHSSAVRFPIYPDHPQECDGWTLAARIPTKPSQRIAVLQALVGHCEAWRANFTGLLNSIALRELHALHEYFESNSAALRRPPSNLDTLAEAVQLHRKLTLDKPAIQARFDPLHDKYCTLEKFEVRLTDQIMPMSTIPGVPCL